MARKQSRVRRNLRAKAWQDVPAVREIWIEQPPDQPAGEGVRDRLRRAAADPGHDPGCGASPPAGGAP